MPATNPWAPGGTRYSPAVPPPFGSAPDSGAADALTPWAAPDAGEYGPAPVEVGEDAYLPDFSAGDWARGGSVPDYARQATSIREVYGAPGLQYLPTEEQMLTQQLITLAVIAVAIAAPYALAALSAKAGAAGAASGAAGSAGGAAAGSSGGFLAKVGQFAAKIFKSPVGKAVAQGGPKFRPPVGLTAHGYGLSRVAGVGRVLAATGQAAVKLGAANAVAQAPMPRVSRQQIRDQARQLQQEHARTQSPQARRAAPAPVDPEPYVRELENQVQRGELNFAVFLRRLHIASHNAAASIQDPIVEAIIRLLAEAKARYTPLGPPPTPRYLFNNKGELDRTNPAGRSDLGGILTKDGKSIGRMFKINDPLEDGRYLDKPTLNDYPVTPKIHVLGPVEVRNILYGINPDTRQPYTDMAKVSKLSFREKFDYAMRESVHGNQLDTANNIKVINGQDLYLIDGIAYNASDAGNFMWGYAMNDLGMPWFMVKVGSEYYAWKEGKSSNTMGSASSDPTPGNPDYPTPEWVKDVNKWLTERTWTGDTAGDQQAIRNGYLYKRGSRQRNQNPLPNPRPATLPWQIPQFDRFKWLLIFFLSAGLGACKPSNKPQPVAARAVAEAFYRAHHRELPTPWMHRGKSYIIGPTRTFKEDGKKWLIYRVMFSNGLIVGAGPEEFQGSFSDHPRFQAMARQNANQKYITGDSGGPETQALMAIFHVSQNQAWPTILHISDSAIADYHRLAQSMYPTGATFGSFGKHQSFFGFSFRNPKMTVINCADEALFAKMRKNYSQRGIIHNLAPDWYWYEDTVTVE